ncbi:hypothetical protein Verru16b_00797 [Lacunisphaera limnophila]|uniref:DUF6268 domain-containing protein n=1 Tax=Lacunisphaera limnophila TaxID=1838286 RepID=A0A1D8AS91_9BACT|nr:DUF6268 family outer membrane beta-barrel protein [Lacunisphaera limnophila]AOS43742.1 hypothetical protein Verru16b_00797 [Lacunisphaera limnophila]
MSLPSLLRPLSLLCLGLVTVHAQPAPVPGAEFTVLYSRSADNALALRGTNVGSVAVDATQLSWRSSVPLSSVTRFTYGLDWNRFDFQRPAASAVPGTLQEIALALGASHRLGREWLLIGNLSPGLYGDLKGDSGDAFNAPLLLLATWLRSPTLAWAFGLRVDGLADRPVIPFIGVNWKFAPDWEFSLGMPRAGVSYAATPDLKWTLGLSVPGGSFHIARDPRPVSAGPRLDDTTLNFHEIRVGLSADWRLNRTFSLNAEAGLITDQKFDYFDRGYVLNGDAAGFFTLGLTGRF